MSAGAFPGTAIPSAAAVGSSATPNTAPDAASSQRVPPASPSAPGDLARSGPGPDGGRTIPSSAGPGPSAPAGVTATEPAATGGRSAATNPPRPSRQVRQSTGADPVPASRAAGHAPAPGTVATGAVATRPCGRVVGRPCPLRDSTASARVTGTGARPPSTTRWYAAGAPSGRVTTTSPALPRPGTSSGRGAGTRSAGPSGIADSSPPATRRPEQPEPGQGVPVGRVEPVPAAVVHEVGRTALGGEQQGRASSLRAGTQRPGEHGDVPRPGAGRGRGVADRPRGRHGRAVESDADCTACGGGRGARGRGEHRVGHRDRDRGAVGPADRGEDEPAGDGIGDRDEPRRVGGDGVEHTAALPAHQRPLLPVRRPAGQQRGDPERQEPEQRPRDHGPPL
ncbi:hypothetical protein Ae168Ps1_2490 [Pseudonocardia sp. Ae168_Ps1]|uniref:hypothetical protein n=1 Tax=Pseudonocardia sp. Ae150A_Ps1 TaxID=1885028 RepID=UPI0009596692|nr:MULTISPECIES: hypothetical protein [unclassified Pseudonocardia]OLL74105.1 hypothetical protein Ae150APs1_2483 [Pseudonocardia sp. Ae150A_Ps1]OLL80084.1 hypothetical protein Ae168Ps1_2490 [Pseudonocardia sp. Ae168_Ps1]OLL85785.1 hypothetical protein Ae263Ps1_2840c [Pseudonocardia sp. Ae263_Ps1]OLL94184.1 hypothetical protein Ae356Ps1_4081 [Pseudonocardia sp. Ae356_Ps1]